MGSFFSILKPEDLNKRMKIYTNYFFAGKNNKNIAYFDFIFVFFF